MNNKVNQRINMLAKVSVITLFLFAGVGLYSEGEAGWSFLLLAFAVYVLLKSLKDSDDSE